LRRGPGYGRIDCAFNATGADLLFLSSHKLGGPKGAGALVAVRRDLLPKALVRGGGQERGFRGGTENVAAIAGFGAAAAQAELSRVAETGRLAGLRDILQAGVLEIAPEVAIFGSEAARVGNTMAFACRVFRPKPWLQPSMSKAWRCLQVRPVLPAR